MESIERIFLCPNGAIVVFDKRGQQVVEWQTNTFCDHLRKMLDARVITRNTIIELPGKKEMYVSDWVGSLEPSTEGT